MNDELINKIKAQLYDRASSPVLFAFLITWIVWNIRTVLLIFSSDKLELKLKVLDLLYPHKYSYFLQGILFPTISAGAFILIYPYIARYAYVHWQTENIKLKKKQQKLEDLTPATQEEINEIRKKSIDQQITLEKEINELNMIIKEQKIRINELVQISNKFENDYLSSQNIIKTKVEEISALESNLEEQLKTKNTSLKKEPKSATQATKIKDEIDLKSNFWRKNSKAYNIIQKYISKNKNSIGPSQIELLIIMTLKNGSLYVQDAIEMFKNISNIEFNYIVQSLDSKGLIDTRNVKVGTKILKQLYLTPEGNKFIVENGLTEIINLTSDTTSPTN